MPPVTLSCSCRMLLHIRCSTSGLSVSNCDLCVIAEPPSFMIQWQGLLLLLLGCEAAGAVRADGALEACMLTDLQVTDRKTHVTWSLTRCSCLRLHLCAASCNSADSHSAAASIHLCGQACSSVVRKALGTDPRRVAYARCYQVQHAWVRDSSSATV